MNREKNGLDEFGLRGYAHVDASPGRTPTTFTILAAVPAALLTAMYFYERRRPTPLRARAARSTLVNALRGRR